MIKSIHHHLSIVTAAFMAAAMIASCNKDEVITVADRPGITLDNPDGVYTVKACRELSINPTYTNVENASYAWSCDGQLIATTPGFRYTWAETGTYYLDLAVTNDAGTTTGEMRVEVVDLALPTITLAVPENGLTIQTGTEYTFNPEIANSEDTNLVVEWKLNGKTVGSEATYIFHADTPGDYDLVVTTSNDDGSDSKAVRIKVVDHLPFVITFPTPSMMQTATTRYTFAGRPVYLTPQISGADPISYAWTVDGRATDCNTATFKFTPDKPGEYQVGITVNGMATASVTVVCVDGDEHSRFRKATAASRAEVTKVFEYIPAPGQFINETVTGGMTGNETTPEAANTWAESRLAMKNFVSLGAWGGYIIVGFDHSIPRKDGTFTLAVGGNATGKSYDFAVGGNAILNAATSQGGGNEPGIIYVMQDVNGNGLPDDEWYELRGSETGQAATWQDYAVTYYRPGGPAADVPWTDNRGQTGKVDYLKNYHKQDCYYPAWIEAESYTLRGTRLAPRTYQDPENGMWDNWAFPWGYSDNMGTDNLQGGDTADGTGQRNGFLIENAMYPDLTPIPLQYIDFVKIQTGVNSKAGWLGENSTEVFSVTDLSIQPQAAKANRRQRPRR